MGTFDRTSSYGADGISSRGNPIHHANFTLHTSRRRLRSDIHEFHVFSLLIEFAAVFYTIFPHISNRTDIFYERSKVNNNNIPRATRVFVNTGDSTTFSTVENT